MEIEKIDYNRVQALSSKDLAYINKEDFLKPYYSYDSNLESFKKAINDRKKNTINREILADELTLQYQNIDPSESTRSNIELLRKDNTFTIITAHQPSLFGGPMYYLYKISSNINLCRQLNEKYSDYNFVPIFINGSEDHDFEEINHFHLFGKKIEWNKESHGPVGRLDTEGLASLINDVEGILGESPNAQKMVRILKKSLENGDIYNEFVMTFVNELFGRYGLVIANTDRKAFKQIFAPYIKKEITGRESQKLVNKTQDELDAHGFKPQAHARDINLFYLDTHGRNRITYEEGKYKVLDTDISWSEAEILDIVDQYPERFSPNVVFRPLYQEVIFPNLAYIGGGGEIAYWLERKSQFEHYGVYYPMLIRRNSALLLNGGSRKKMKQVGFSYKDIFSPKHQSINDFLTEASSIDLDLSKEKKAMVKIWKEIAVKAQEIDPTLKKATLAEMTNQLKSIDSIESRLKRKIKSDEEINVNRIDKLYESLFPGNGLQERYDNFMQYYIEAGDELIDYLVNNLDPMDKQFAIINL